MSKNHADSTHLTKTDAPSHPTLAIHTPHGSVNHKPQDRVFAEFFPKETKRPLSATILKPLPEVYELSKNLESLSRFFENVHVPMKLIEARPNESVVWRTEDAAGIQYSIAISFSQASGQQGTVARLMVGYDDKIAAFAAKFEMLFGENIELMAKKALQRFKATCETGNFPTTEGQPHGEDQNQSSQPH